MNVNRRKEWKNMKNDLIGYVKMLHSLRFTSFFEYVILGYFNSCVPDYGTQLNSY